MRLAPDHPLAVALAADRQRVNAQFEAARARRPGLDGAAVLDALADLVGPLAEEAEVVGGETVGAVLDALVPLVLETVGRGEVEGTPAGQAWARALHGCRAHVVRSPRRVARALLQAVRRLARTDGADAVRWADRLASLADHAPTAGALLDAGAVLAWREGMARLRTGALRVAASLPPPLALAALGVPDAPTDALPRVLDSLYADPWLAPVEALRQRSEATGLQIRAVCGGFAGFGGPFVRPPELATDARGVVATDGDRWWRLHADVFGAAFQRIDAPGPATPSPVPMLTNGRVSWRGHTADFPQLAGRPGAVATDEMLAVVIPQSHRVAVIAP
ncbi:MAG: hypothetical protein AAGK21_04190 [Bacteroidota bacterium]